MSLLAIPLSIALTILCWGTYGVLLHKGALQMDHSRLLPFICLGVAYFVLAVVPPAVWLRLYGEKGKWTATGTLWSFIAGAAGALGALGIILALTFGGNPIYVMPLVFGGAPVVNTFTTMYMGRSFRNISPVFIAGLILVITGAVLVLVFKPGAGAGSEGLFGGLSAGDFALILGSVLLTVLTWGAYGPMLHRGQMAMQGSRLRPLLCVGLAYFVIAVVLPLILRPLITDPGDWTVGGTLWSLGGGAVGALGAIGIILAFNYGGKPIYVMPLVFGGAPLINTFASMAAVPPSESIGPVFIAGLIIVVIGAVTVLVFAPKTPPHSHTPAPAPTPTTPASPRPEPAKS
jgi:hypothetical protein